MLSCLQYSIKCFIIQLFVHSDRIPGPLRNMVPFVFYFIFVLFLSFIVKSKWNVCIGSHREYRNLPFQRQMIQLTGYTCNGSYFEDSPSILSEEVGLGQPIVRRRLSIRRNCVKYNTTCRVLLFCTSEIKRSLLWEPPAF